MHFILPVIIYRLTAPELFLTRPSIANVLDLSGPSLSKHLSVVFSLGDAVMHPLSQVDTMAALHQENESILEQIPKSPTHNSSTLSRLTRVKLYDVLYFIIAHQPINGLCFTMVYQ
jgi:hypothetical protein